MCPIKSSFWSPARKFVWGTLCDGRRIMLGLCMVEMCGGWIGALSMSVGSKGKGKVEGEGDGKGNVRKNFKTSFLS